MGDFENKKDDLVGKAKENGHNCIMQIRIKNGSITFYFFNHFRL